MSFVINHPTRGTIKIKTFDAAALKQEKKRASLTKIAAIVRNWIDLVKMKKDQDQLTIREAAFINMAESWCDIAEDFAKNGCLPSELLQVAKTEKVVEGFSSLTENPGEVFWIDLLAVTPPNLIRPHSGIGTTLVASACLEGYCRGCAELYLTPLGSADSFYQGLGMKTAMDSTGYSIRSFDLSQPLPSSLDRIRSLIHPAKRDRTVSQEEELSSKKRRSNLFPALR